MHKGVEYALIIIWAVVIISFGFNILQDSTNMGMFSTGIASIALGIAPFFLLYSERKKEKAKQLQKAEEKQSGWENNIAAMVRTFTHPSETVIRNDRTVIPSRHGGPNLEIDIYIPSLKLGIEANGEHWHNHNAYNNDKRNGTELSTEAYKERWCARHGIELIHVWDSQSDSEIRNILRSTIESRRDM